MEQTEFQDRMSDEGQELCHQKASENCSSLMIRAWQSALQTERMEWQTDEVRRRAKECGGWSEVYHHRVGYGYCIYHFCESGGTGS